MIDKCVVCGKDYPSYMIWVRCSCNHPVCQNCFLNHAKKVEMVMKKLHKG